MKFWRRRQFDSSEIEQLEQQLWKVGAAKLPVKKQQSLKRQLFASIEHQQHEGADLLPQTLRNIGEQVKEVGTSTMLSNPERVKMKERLLSFIQRTNWLGLAFGPFHGLRLARFFRLATSSALLLFFVMTSVFIFPFQVPLTYAARLTYIDDLAGQVYVMRSGKLIEGKKEFPLQEGDVLITKENSTVTVRFFDDSVSRLDSNTQVEVKRLYAEPFNPVATQVELLLEDGHMWTRVLNLIDENSHFMIATPGTSAIVTKKAAFDLQTHVYSTTLSVFDNVVDFAMDHGYPSDTRPVLAGFQAQVLQENGASVTKIIPVAEGMHGNREVAQWIESNLRKDKVHTQLLAQENHQALEDTSAMADVLQTTDDLQDTKKLANEAIEAERAHFLDAYKRLMLGQTYLMRQQGREGMQLVLEFGSTVRSIMVRYPEYRQQDPLNANLLLSLIQAKVAEQRKDLATLLPGDTLYPVKEEMDNVELYLAGSDVDKAKVQLSQSEDKLLEVQDLLEKENFEKAQAVLVRYQRQIDNLVLKVNSENASELQDKLVSLFDQQIEQIKVLTAIEKSLFETQTDLLKQVRDLRQQVLKKLMNALEKVNGDLPVSLIQELRDLLQTYMDGGAYDESFVELLNKMLVKYARNDVSTQKKLPSELGLVTIIEEDATREVQAKPVHAAPVKHPQTTQESCGSTEQCKSMTIKF